MMNVETVGKLLLATALALSMFTFPVYAGTAVKTWFFRSDYVLGEANTDSFSQVEISRSSPSTFFHGFLGFKVYVDSKQLTSSISGVITLKTNVEGFHSVEVKVSPASLNLNVSKVKVEVYMRLGVDAEWQLKAVFTSQPLPYTRVGGTWTFNIYAGRSTSTEGGSRITLLFFRFGSSLYNSCITDVSLTEPTVYDWMSFHLRNGNLVGFIVHPYISVAGNMFYGLLALLLCVPLYVRYRSITVILFTLVLFGGAGGVISLLIPESGLNLAWLLFVLGLAGLLYKVFR